MAGVSDNSVKTDTCKLCGATIEYLVNRTARGEWAAWVDAEENGTYDYCPEGVMRHEGDPDSRAHEPKGAGASGR